jgi:hypothetical protein
MGTSGTSWTSGANTPGTTSTTIDNLQEKFVETSLIETGALKFILNFLT